MAIKVHKVIVVFKGSVVFRDFKVMMEKEDFKVFKVFKAILDCTAIRVNLELKGSEDYKEQLGYKGVKD